jgi:hypothetical protein
MSSAAELLKRALAGSQGHAPQPITDEFALAIAKRLESRGIVKVPGMPDKDDEMQWYDKLIELDRQHKEFEREREAREQAEQEVVAPQTTAGIVRAAIACSSGSSGHIALNGAAVLRAALAGGPGTINGGVAE